MEKIIEDIKTAINNYPLFKFTKYDCYAKENLIESQLFFKRPDEFDDPFECITIPCAQNPESEKQLFEELRLKDTQKEFVDGSINDYISKIKNRRELFEFGKKKISETYSVFCCSKSCANILLWSHYAKGKNGLCLVYGFDRKYENKFYTVELENGKKVVLFDVIYSSELPEYDFSDFQGERNRKILYTKSIDWAYENECRFILKKDSGKQKINKNYLKGIIFGPDFQEQDKVKQLIKENYKHTVKYFVACISLKKYEIEIYDGNDIKKNVWNLLD